ncbi:nucleotidyltransferase domain-containing protein [Sulfurimonas hydrogeniphila]|uniref:nucleotidyltransferase domain-containing protein n=1 Tax=Sulfurimonas hydrogeniphila TaxID=2509341 RepID=UPI00125F0551|nr:nucleotidyltransferase domain-containing protein [Sulfurimonas hydrogeniphila]
MDINQIKRILQRYDTVENALLFGSYATNTQHNMSDMDIAVQTSRELNLFEMGDIIASLETELNHKIDFVIFNELYKTSPLLAYNIYKNHTILILNNKKNMMSSKKMLSITILILSIYLMSKTWHLAKG